MERPFRQFIRAYFHFGRKDRRGIRVLGILLLLIIAGHVAVDNLHIHSRTDYSAFKRALNAWEKEKTAAVTNRRLFVFNPNRIGEEELKELAIPAFVKENILKYRAAGGNFKSPADLRKIYGMNDSIFAVLEQYIRFPSFSEKQDRKTLPRPPEDLPEEEPLKKQPTAAPRTEGTFDPNKADREVLARFGFNRFQARNLIGYRENGGIFRVPGDLQKIYGVDSAFFSAIRRNIKIEGGKAVQPGKEPAKPAEPFELNGADSLQLMNLSGVGPAFAGRILKFRNLLGGFYSGDQLREVYHITDQACNNILENSWIDTLRIKKLRLNFAAYPELLRHPYLEKRHVEAILHYREENGPFASLQEVLRAGVIDTSSFEIVRPYLSVR